MTFPTHTQGEPGSEPAETTQPPEQHITPPAEPGTSDAGFAAPFNINDVPEAMRPHVEAYNKQLQGAFTRKTQELATERRTLEEQYAPARDLYDRLHAEDEATRDAAVRDALKAGGWDDLTAEEQQAVQEAVQDQQQRTQQPAPQADQQTRQQLQELQQWRAQQDAKDQQAAQDRYLDEFTNRYTSAVDTWAKTNGYESGDELPDHLKNQIAGYVRGVPVLEENGNAFPNMDAALTLLDADRAAYLTSKEGGLAPNTAAVTAQSAPIKPKTEADRLALANQIAARHV